MRTNKVSAFPAGQSIFRLPFFHVLAAAFLIVPIVWPVSSARAQAPGLLWSTSVGAKLFASDAQTNAYAYFGGSVIQIGSDGVPVQTNAICPRPGIARRDDSGNFYFGGNFDGTQDFGGITLVGGWTNFPTSGNWTPGYPTCFLAKYDSGGILQWVVSFGGQAVSNYVTDVLLDASGASYIGYVKFNNNIEGTLARVDPFGNFQWDQTAQAYRFSRAVTLGGLTESNCCFCNFRSDPFNQTEVGRVDINGNSYLLGQYPLRQRSSAANNGKPVIDDLAQTLAVGQCFDPNTNPTCSAQVLRKYGAGTSLVWEREVTPEAQWSLARDAQANVYLAGTNGMFAMFDTDGHSVWSNNFSGVNLSGVIDSMVVDTNGNRFVSFTDGSVARLAAEAAPQSPSIVANPQPVTVFVGDPVTLSVAAAGTPTLKYFWRFNGTNLPGATDIAYTFSNAAPSQSGPYTVLVTNSLGSVTSAPALVRVKSVELYWNNQLLTNGTYVFPTPPALTIRSVFASGSSFYTLDGSAPDFSSVYYSGAFTVSNSATVRAIGYSADFSQSEEADAVNIVVPARHTLSVSTSGGGIVTTNPLQNANCVSPSGAVAWWRAEGNTQDSIGTNPGVLYNGAGYGNGLVGQAFDLRASGAHVRITNAPALNPTAAMTVEAWLYLVGGSGAIVSKWDGVASRSQNSFDLRVVDNPVGSHTTVFAISPDGASSVSVLSGSVPSGAWAHLAGTFDGSTLRIYVNGVLSAQTSFSGSIFSGADDLGIGGTVGGAAPGFSAHEFNGLIDEPALYNRALSAAEIQAIYQAGANGKCPSPPFTNGSFIETDTVTLTASPFPGNTFLYWLADAGGTSPTINVSMERDKSIYAVFGTTLSTTVAGHGQIQLYPPGGAYPYGTVVRLTGIPDPGYYFGLWGNAATGNTNPLYFTVAAPTQTVSSIFGTVPGGQAALTVLITGKGRVNVSPRANVYALNTSVTLTPVPDASQSFLNWSGDASGTANPLSISMTQSKTITANFSGGGPRLRVDRPGIEGFSPQGFRMTVLNDPSSVAQILVSTNLTSWNLLGTVTNTSLEAPFLDPTATNAPKKFYKATP